MSAEVIKCVLLADRHHGLSESIRGLLETEFEAVVMVADEKSLLESTVRLQPSVVVADLALAQGESFGWLRRLLVRCPGTRVIVLSSYDATSLQEVAMEAGAVGFVRKSEIAMKLLPTIDTVLAGAERKVAGSPDAAPSP